MRHSHPSRRPIHDILALAVIALCTLVVVATMLFPSAGFAPLLPLVGGAVVVVQHYFEKRA